VIRTLSNRADLISGGDALVEVVAPADVRPADVRVTLNGADVTDKFAVRADGRFTALLDGLTVGPNDVDAKVLPTPRSTRPGGRSAARLTIDNHPASGPVFSGKQLQPWVCAQPTVTPTTVTIFDTVPLLTATVNSRASGLDAAADANCTAAPKFTYWYEPKAREGGTCLFTNTGATRCFEPYDVANPPAAADIADFTNDRGDTSKAIVRVERGTIDRGIYDIATLYDPSQPAAPWAPPAGWNGKLYWIFGASSGVSRFQSVPANSVWNNTALRRGFMVATASLTDHGTNANDTLGAETVMMTKEHIAETYGPIRYTMGAGCSGGSIMQYNIASGYPGLVDGIQPNCTFPDTFTTAIEVMDCGPRVGPLLHNADRGGADDGAACRDPRAHEHGLLHRVEPLVPADVQPRRRGQLRQRLAVVADIRQGAAAAGDPLHRGRPRRRHARHDRRERRRSSASGGNQSAAGDIHANWRAWEARSRLDRANGNHDNQVIWGFTGGGAAQPGASLALLSFTTLDQWLAGVEADTSSRPTEEKIVAAKPAAAIDRCLNSTGATDAQVAANLSFDDPSCPVKFQGSPRMAAGGPLSEDVFKCQTKPLDFSSADYAGIAFTDAQKARLAAVFPGGVCDWSKPGIGQDAVAHGWTTFANGPGGEPLGPPPVSRGGCPGQSESAGNAKPGGCPGQSAGPGR